MPREFHWNERLYREETAALNGLRLPDEVLLLATDFSDCGRTVARLVEARRRGEIAVLYPFLADPGEKLLQQVGSAIAQHTDEAQRYTQLLALRDQRLNVNQKPLREAAVYDAATIRAAQLALKLSDVVTGFTAAEKERWSTLTGKPMRRFAYLPVPAAHAACKGERGLAVYAPESPRAQLALVELALRERRHQAAFISAENSEVPIEAATLIVPGWWRPARIASLCAAGYRVVAPVPGHPADRCGSIAYQAHDVFGLTAAIDAAQSASSSPCVYFNDSSGETAAAAAQAALPSRTGGPAASVIVRTYDRPELLRRALRSIVAQTYADLEIVVVNNGGADVEALVSDACAHRPYRYVPLAERAHISAASNAGARASSGTYIAYLDDDDLLYPDHLARSVDALERSGADLSYTNCLAEYAQMSGENKHVLGFQIFRDNEFVAKDLYLDNVAPIHSIVHRRDLFERFGYFDETLPVTDDWEMWLRASRGARFIHVDHVTCEYSWRHDPSRGNMTLSHQRHFAQSYEKITARYAADVAAFPGITAQQTQIKAGQQQRAQQLELLGPRIAELTIAAMAQNAVPAAAAADPFA